jgi:hypothetical protein
MIKNFFDISDNYWAILKIKNFWNHCMKTILKNIIDINFKRGLNQRKIEILWYNI